MSLSIDEKWAKVKEFYEENYKQALSKGGVTFKFRSRLADHKIEWLYDQMVKVKEELHDFYFFNPWVIDRMRKCREEPETILKRAPWK